MSVVCDGETELFGVFFDSIAGIGTGYGGTVVLGGSWWIREVLLCAGDLNAPAIGHAWRFALGDVVPSSVAGMNELEEVFAGLDRSGIGKPTLRYPTSQAVVRFTGRFPIRPMGRRLVVSWINASASVSDGSAFFVMERSG